MTRMRKGIVTILLIFVVIVLAVPALFWLVQDRLIFFPQPVASTAHLPAGTAPFEVRAADGTTLRGWMVPADVSKAPVIVYFGGNAEEVSWAIASDRWPRGYARIALNYRGYGTSEGRPSATKLLADGLAIHDAVASRRDVDNTRIVAFGRSLAPRWRRTSRRIAPSRARFSSRLTIRSPPSAAGIIRSCRSG